MEDASEITKLWSTKEQKEFSPLFTRQDEDYELWDMTPSPSPSTGYESEVRSKTKEHSSGMTVTSNELRVFSDNVQSTLASSDMQIMVRMAEAEGEDKRGDIGKLERLFYFALEKGDERLARLLLPPLREATIWCSLVRGWVAGRFLVYKSGKNVIFDLVSWDPRWLVYEVGDDGFLWTGYKTFKSKAALESLYKYPATTGNNEVIDFWKYIGEGKMGNAVVFNNVFLKKPEVYKMPSMPVLVKPISTRPPIAGTEGIKLKGYGESIFAPSRNIHALRNRFASMVANHANQMANQALINYKTELGRTIDSTANVPGGVLELTMGENRLEPSPMKEISPTVVNMLAWLNDQMERATLPKIPIDSPPPSGTLYNLATEAGNRVWNPQLRNLNYFYSDILRLIEEQMIAGGIKVKVQGEEKRKYYETQVTPIDLKRPHIIKVEFTARTPYTQMDTAQVAQMLKSLGLPDGWIWENILKVQDPKALADLAAIELFEHSPKGAMKRAIEALVETRGDIVAAQSLVRDLDRLEVSEQMMAQGGVEGSPEAPAPPMEGVV